MIIQVENIENGMVLEEPILNNLGFVIVPSGFELTEKHIKMLNNWNVKTVSVISESEKQDREFSPELLDRAKEIINDKIKWEPRNIIEQIMIEKSILAVAELIKKNKYYD